MAWPRTHLHCLDFATSLPLLPFRLILDESARVLRFLQVLMSWIDSTSSRFTIGRLTTGSGGSVRLERHGHRARQRWSHLSGEEPLLWPWKGSRLRKTGRLPENIILTGIYPVSFIKKKPTNITATDWGVVTVSIYNCIILPPGSLFFGLPLPFN